VATDLPAVSHGMDGERVSGASDSENNVAGPGLPGPGGSRAEPRPEKEKESRG
jgi:hypothetical protein